eukprot:gene27308-32985_t
MENMKRWNQMFRTQPMYDAAREQVEANDIQDPRLVGFYIRGGELWSSDDRVVVSPENVLPTLQHEFEEHETHFKSGAGVKVMWHWLARKYINIDRADVQNFMSKKGISQVVRAPKVAKTRIVVAKRPLQILACDLIDMSNFNPNGRFRYIFVCVDLYSRYTWASPLKTKTALNNSSLEIDMVLDDISDKWPDKKVQACITDRGGEFLGRFAQLLKQRHIKHLLTDSHSPNQNGITERRNREIRRVLRSYAADQVSFEWWKNLDNAIEALNQAYVRTLGAAPIDAIRDESDNPRHQRLVEKSANAMAKLARREGSLSEGDKVRVRMDLLFSDQRRKNKAGENKSMPVKFSPILFSVLDTIKPRGRFGRWKYSLYNASEDDVIRDRDGRKILFR